MYYKSVNRGLAFTKPGLYSFGFILAVGMIAVASGLNGLYIFLAAGLGGFIVSGLLSERAMKSCAVKQAAAGIVSAGERFPLVFNIENRSSWFVVYAVQTYFFLEKPRARLISRRLPSLLAHVTGKLPAATTVTCSGQCNELPRGSYTKLLAMQQTTFPFGILEKYKFTEIDASIMVAPAVDAAFLVEARALVKRRIAALEADREFFSHRAYTHKDSLKYLDWKKSAGRRPDEWVVKVFRSKDATAPVVIEATWAAALAAVNEKAYEDYLSRVRTVCFAVNETGRTLRLEFGGLGSAPTYDAALALLAGIARFSERASVTIAADGLGAGGGGKTLRVVVDERGTRWAA